ncbi:M16 family metallopeptidase [Propionicicella superfundia]|uniref:M16 family metallopeptidase n=1 Tax=Propionicicella superfundia TaxID=348582 RepID=UPI0006888A1E|nr:pitrilysin family protein [Propionicicella superfundia]
MSVVSPQAVDVTYPVHEFRLANGLHVIVSPDHSAPIVAVNLWYDVGSRDEHRGQWGLAHLFEHLMFEGSAHTGKGEHLQLMQSVGGQVNATTWFDRTNYFETVPIGALDLAVWLEADRLASVGAHLTAENVANQQDVVISERRQRYDNAPYGDVLEHIVRIAFPDDHPYGHTTIGAVTDIEAVTVETAAAFFAAHYGPDTAVLSLVGDVTPEAGLAVAERHFGGLPPVGRAARDVPAPLPPLESGSTVEVTGRVAADAAYAVWRLPAHGTTELDALGYALLALGSGQNSRLHRRLVRGDAIAADVGTSVFELAGGNSIGLAYALGLPGTPAEALAAALRSEVARLADGTTADEHLRARATLEREWLAELASVDDRADRFGEYTTLHGDPGLVNGRLAALAGVSRAAVAAATARWLSPASAGFLHYRRAEA